MVLSVGELIDLAIMTLALGFIFKDIFKAPEPEEYDPLKPSKSTDNFLFACAVVAPAIILHEMAHKFVALAFGLKATFHAAMGWLGIGVILKLIGSSFIFFIPGFVSISPGTPLQMAITAGAGPFMNLFLWGIASLLLAYNTYSKKVTVGLIFTKKVNLFLFFFNMIPIPPFDGSSFFSNLIGAFF